MFTGIVTEVGTVTSSAPSAAGRTMEITAPATTRALAVGDSVAVNGVCLTAVEVDGARFSVDVVHESLDRTGLGSLASGNPVNLERPMAADGRYDGHIVQGHVDGVGIVASVTDEGGSRRMRISMPQRLARYVVEKGSVAVDGVSLTVTDVTALDSDDHAFEVALIPHTLDVTVLGIRVPGETVNLEVDVVAKYVERMLEGRT
jgi:riboflavin synthase